MIVSTPASAATLVLKTPVISFAVLSSLAIESLNLSPPPRARRGETCVRGASESLPRSLNFGNRRAVSHKTCARAQLSRDGTNLRRRAHSQTLNAPVPNRDERGRACSVRRQPARAALAP